jgi:hypothetical protein
MNHENSGSMFKAAAVINLLAGVWFFVSPWIYHAWRMEGAWNSWIVGALIAILSGIRLATPLDTRGLSVINLLLGAWAFVSPWIYGYTMDKPLFVNSLCVGIVVFVLAAYNSSIEMGHTHHQPPPLHS